jgi:hypothetical protein
MNTQIQNLPTNSLSSTQLADLQNSVQSNTVAISNLSAQEANDKTNLQNQINSNTSNISTNTTLINNLTTKQVNDISNLQTQLNSNTTSINNLSSKQIRDVTNLQNQIVTNINNIASANTLINNLTTKEFDDISNLQTQITSNTTNITTLMANSSSGSSSVSLFSTDQTNLNYINNKNPNTIGYQVYQQILMSGSKYYLPHNTSTSATTKLNICNFTLTPIGSVWIITMSLVPGPIVNSYNRLMTCFINVTDSASVYLYTTLQIVDFQYLNPVSFTFTYYNRSGGDLKVYANTNTYNVGENYYFQNLNYLATRIA